MLIHSKSRVRRRGFTLQEMMIVIMIIGILAALSMSALSGAAEQAREKRTQSIIAKVDQLIMEQYESYKTRPVPIRVPAGSTPRFAALARLNATRELMRLELPDRISDLATDAEITDLADNSLGSINPGAARMQVLSSLPSLTRSYKRTAGRSISTGKPWTTQHQGAECLYLIISKMRDGDKNALDFFSATEIGDVDGDGMPEILDAWGRPIEFIRWAPGYLPVNGALTMQTNDPKVDPVTNLPAQPLQPLAPDQFDPLRADPRWDPANPSPNKPYALYPLIFSAGKDGQYDVNAELIDTSGNAMPASFRSPPNDPYGFGIGVLIGTPADVDNDGPGYGDNITNHFVQSQ